jgi:hypothetical protein
MLVSGRELFKRAFEGGVARLKGQRDHSIARFKAPRKIDALLPASLFYRAADFKQ